MNKHMKRALVVAVLLAVSPITATRAGDDRTACSITLKNGYYQPDENDNGNTNFWVYDGDDTVLSTARKTKDVSYGKSWESYCEVNGQDYCKVRYQAAISYVMEEWALDVVHVPCNGTLETTDGHS